MPEPTHDAFEAAWIARGITEHVDAADYRHWMRLGWDAALATQQPSHCGPCPSRCADCPIDWKRLEEGPHA